MDLRAVTLQEKIAEALAVATGAGRPSMWLDEADAVLDAVREHLLSDESVEAALDRIDWYRRCLEDIQDGRSVRGLTEAKLGYDSAIDELRSFSAALGDRPAPDAH